jgi:NADH-quinone oxidoreductase subunit A
MEQYLPIVVLMVLATLFAGLSLAGSRFLGPKRPTSAKQAPYECGIIPNRQPPQRFPVRFYLVAMIFVIFDIEIIFIYPWAVMYHQLDTFGLGEMVAFSIAVLVAFLYLISGGALDWGPAKRVAAADVPASRYTSTTATVRRVPRPEALLAGLEPMEGTAAPAPPADAPSPEGPAPDRVPATTGH